MTITSFIATPPAAPDLDEIAAEISRGLASAEVFGGRAYLRTPMLLPSGASVVVVIEQEGAGRCRIVTGVRHRVADPGPCEKS